MAKRKVYSVLSCGVCIAYEDTSHRFENCAGKDGREAQVSKENMIGRGTNIREILEGDKKNTVEKCSKKGQTHLRENYNYYANFVKQFRIVHSIKAHHGHPLTVKYGSVNYQYQAKNHVNILFMN